MSSSIYSQSKGRLLTLTDLQSYSPPPVIPLIHSGILTVGSRAVIFGDEGTFKSALATHAAYSLARGSKWLTFSTTQSNILYIQAEMDLSQSKERMEQYQEGSKSIFLAKDLPIPNKDSLADQYAKPDNLIIERVSEDLNIDTENGYQFIRNELKLMITELPLRPIVLITDPLFKMFRYDLVKEDDIKMYTRNIDRLLKDKELWSNHPGMASIVVHHTRKIQVDKEGNAMPSPRSMDMFGSGHLKWWHDTILKLDLDPDDETQSTIFATFTKHRRARYTPPKFTIFWDRNTYHPFIQSIHRPRRPETFREFRGSELAELE